MGLGGFPFLKDFNLFLSFFILLFLIPKMILNVHETKSVLPSAACTIATVGGAMSCFIFCLLPTSNHLLVFTFFIPTFSGSVLPIKSG